LFEINLSIDVSLQTKHTEVKAVRHVDREDDTDDVSYKNKSGLFNITDDVTKSEPKYAFVSQRVNTFLCYGSNVGRNLIAVLNCKQI